MTTDVISEKDGFVIRLAKADDAVNYYEQNYCPLDKEVARLTGCKEEFSKEEVVSFFLKSLEENDRYFFLNVFIFHSIVLIRLQEHSNSYMLICQYLFLPLQIILSMIDL